MEFGAQNVNEAYTTLVKAVKVGGWYENSRNGPVISIREPVTVRYGFPQEMVLFNPVRDCNPYFHLLGDALWCLAGRDDHEWPTWFNSNYGNYASESGLIYGAYGHRWRKLSGFDQLTTIVRELRKDPQSRRVVLSMWNPVMDLGENEPDHPCNTTCYFRTVQGRLNLTVLNRSNDLIYGLAGANAVQFGCLLQYVAGAAGLPVGEYYQITNNLHVYPEMVDFDNLSANADYEPDPYMTEQVKPFPLMSVDRVTWDKDLLKFFNEPLADASRYSDPFFKVIASPMYQSYWERKSKVSDGKLALQAMPADNDWRLACEQWIDRRENAKAS